MKKVYLAGPYSHSDPETCQMRFEVLNDIAAELMAKGFIVFSPISHSHPIAVQCDLPKGFEFWEKFDKAFIEWCDLIIVAKLEGWQDSKGIAAEIKIAKEMGKEIEYIDLVINKIVEAI